MMMKTVDGGGDGDEGDTTKLILNANVLDLLLVFFGSSLLSFDFRARIGSHARRHKCIINCLQRLVARIVLVSI